MKKGISTVIAALLMLVITIALAGFAYTYITGILNQRTAVVLDFGDLNCVGEFIQISAINEGTVGSGTVTVAATAHDGLTSAGTCSITNISPGNVTTCSGSGIDRPAGAGGASGSYRIRVTAGGASPLIGNVYCATQGT